MIVISFSSLKGGTGKLSTTIMSAKCFAAAEKKVLVIDADINNSVSFHFLEESKETNSKNIAYALQGDNLKDFVIKTKNENIDLIASSQKLVDLRAMSTITLKRLIPTLEDNYDVVLIDTAPTYDNIVLNCINASDYVVTPVNYDQFNYNTSNFLSQKLRLETDKFDSWYLLFNGHESRYESNPKSLQNQYKSLFLEDEILGNHILDMAIPFTRNVRKFADTEEVLRPSGPTAKLYNAICEFCSIFVEEDERIRPEKF